MNSRLFPRFGILMLLALVMVATRSHHFSALATATWGPLPDASWAVFFAGGYYLKNWTRWAFPMLMALAVLVDYMVISGQGINFWTHYCVSAAYWFLIPTHFALWLGGVWLARQQAGARVSDLPKLAASLLIAVSVAYLISNGSFYWLSDSWLATSASGRSLAGWLKNLGDWYLPYLRVNAIYVAIAAVLHVLAVKTLGRLEQPQDRSLPR